MKKCFLLIILIFSNVVLFAQAPSIEWQKCLGGYNTDYANSVIGTKDGGYIVAGWAQSYDGDVSGNHDYSEDYWIVKLSQSGEIQWQKCLGGSSMDEAYSIAETQDSGYVIAGKSFSNDGDVKGNHGEWDAWIVKINKSGKLIWQKCFGGSRWDEAFSIIETKDGSYIFAGYTSSTDGNITGNHGHDDALIVKLNQSGEVQWQKCLGGSNNDAANSIIETKDGNYIFAGYTVSNDGDVTGHHGLIDYWIVKLNQSGQILWQKCYGGSEHSEPHSIIETRDGSYLIAGYTDSDDGDVKGKHEGIYSDAWVIKLNQTGELQWQKCLGGSYDEKAYSIIEIKDQGYIVAGYTNSNDGDVAGSHYRAGYSDAWIVKLSKAGELQWQKCFGGRNGDEEANSIIESKDGGYLFAGITTSSTTDDVGYNHGLTDYWIVKLTTKTNDINDIEEDNKGNISIFPNPSSNTISIKTKNIEEGNNLLIYNFYGQQIYQSEINNSETKIDISGFAPGAYTVLSGGERKLFFVSR